MFHSFYPSCPITHILSFSPLFYHATAHSPLPSFYPDYSPIISLSFLLPFFFYLGTTSTFPFSVFLPYLSSHTHTLPLSLFLFLFPFFMLSHTPLSQAQKAQNKKKTKKQKKKTTYLECMKKLLPKEK